MFLVFHNFLLILLESFSSRKHKHDAQHFGWKGAKERTAPKKQTENWKEGKIRGNKQDKTQNKTNRRYKRERERTASDENRIVCASVGLCVFFFESDFLTSCYFIREDAKEKNQKTFFSDHTRNFHTEYFFLSGADSKVMKAG